MRVERMNLTRAVLPLALLTLTSGLHGCRPSPGDMEGEDGGPGSDAGLDAGADPDAGADGGPGLDGGADAGLPAFLDDALPYDDSGTAPFPRVTNGGAAGGLDTLTVVEMAKFGAVNGMGGQKLEALKQLHPEILRLRYQSARAYQFPRNSLPVDQTFTGHWLYLAGAHLAQTVDAGQLDLKLDNSVRIQVGQDLVIADDAVTFGHAEHAEVVSKDNATDTVVLAARGYRSTAQPHPAGSFVATHVNGAVPDPTYWAYNMSTTCPLDAQGRRANQVVAEWIGAHFDDDLDPTDGGLLGTYDSYDGLLWDVSNQYIQPNADVDNDGIAEGGFVDGGNVWGDGMEQLFRNVQQSLATHFPGRNLLQIGGVTETGGLDVLAGTQLEGFPQDANITATADWTAIDGELDAYAQYMHVSAQQPRYCELRNKVDPGDGGIYPDVLRFSMGLALLEDGYYSKSNKKGGWWDEFAVDDGGVAIPSTGTDDAKRSASGWLGMPLGLRSRLVRFDASTTRLSNGGFEGGLSGWSGQNVTLSQDLVASAVDGAASLRSAPMTTFSPSPGGATIHAAVTVPAGDYTVAFSLRANITREVDVTLGTVTQTFIARPEWTRKVATFHLDAPATEIVFGVGRESSSVWLDEVYLFDGSADLFRRDFQNGVVVVNGTWVPQTVALEPGVFRRILGTQDPAVNDGSNADSVTLPPHDAVLLQRR